MLKIHLRERYVDDINFIGLVEDYRYVCGLPKIFSNPSCMLLWLGARIELKIIGIYFFFHITMTVIFVFAVNTSPSILHDY